MSNDFALVTPSAHLYRYGKLYRMEFVTNEGREGTEANTDDGTVIFNAQETTKATGRLFQPGKSEANYCTAPTRQRYENCQFARVTACYVHRLISRAPQQTTANWLALLGPQRGMTAAANASPGTTKPGFKDQVTALCDPKPPGSDDADSGG